MYAAIEICKPGTTFDQIGKTIQYDFFLFLFILLFRDYADGFGYAVNEDFGGHGIAHHMHMAPMVFHNETRNSSK